MKRCAEHGWHIKLCGQAGLTRNVGAVPRPVPVQKEGTGMRVGTGVVGMAAVAFLVDPQWFGKAVFKVVLSRWFRAADGKDPPVLAMVAASCLVVGFVRLAVSVTVWRSIFLNVPVLVRRVGVSAGRGARRGGDVVRKVVYSKHMGRDKEVPKMPVVARGAGRVGRMRRCKQDTDK